MSKYTSDVFILQAKKDFKKSFKSSFKDDDCFESAINWIDLILRQHDSIWRQGVSQAINSISQRK